MAVCCLIVAPASAAEQKNIVLILSDDQAYESVARMPYLASRTGWYRFPNAYINNPTCCPSRATILTGQWSHHHGVEATEGAPRFDDSSTVATWLDAAGYRTGLFGKYHLGNVVENEPTTYIPPGWDEWYGWHGINGREAYYGYTLNENGVLVNYGSTPADYSTDVLAGKAVDFVNRNADSPFFLYFAPRAPHDPWTPAPRHAGTVQPAVIHPPNFNVVGTDKPAWWAALAPRKLPDIDKARQKHWTSLLALDEAVKGIVTALKNKSLMRDTVIIYMTDNGYAFGEHRWRGKLCAYEECNHTPLLIKYLGKNDGRVLEQLVGNEDLAPTFAELADTSPASPVDGQSFLPLLRGESPANWENEVLLRSWNRGGSPGNPPTYWGIRTPDYKYIETVDTGEIELYDLAADPFELTNVAGDPSYFSIQLELAVRLAELRDREPQ